MAWRVLACVAVVCALLSLGAHASEAEFLPPAPEDVIKTEGGSLSVWSREFEFFKDANMNAARMEVAAFSLALPEYNDAPQLSFITHGCAFMGLLSPMGVPAPIRYVQEGDIVAIPRGWASWAWNNGSEPLRALLLSDTRSAAEAGEVHAFTLMGGPHEMLGGVLHGFSADLLARAWDVEEEEAKRLVAGQKHVGFIAIGHHNAPRLTAQLQAMLEESDQTYGEEEEIVDSISMNDLEGSNGMKHMHMGDISPFTRFKYSLAHAMPDVSVPKGGDIFVVDRSKLPVLHHVGLSAFLYHLQPSALLAPHWYPNAAILHVVLAGSGRIEVVYPDGRTALHRDVHTGDVIAVPALFPSSMEASEEGMMWIAIANRPLSPPSFLAGATSVFKGIPKHVLMAAFNVEKELEDKFYKARRDPSETAIFPPTEKSTATA